MRRCALALWTVAMIALGATAVASPLQPQPAERTAAAMTAAILGATMAGPRIVAVGDHGIVLLSDDNGATYRQARAVPVRSTLTAVAFADARHGWAVGHWGAVLHTDDGGETWSLQRSDTSVDQPLFTVYFRDALHGWAAGLWSKLLATDDGGTSWTAIEVPTPPGGGAADRNLFHVFPGHDGALFIAAEQGLVLRSDDAGAHWRYLSTGYRGTFWTGAVLGNGEILVGGLRGAVYRSGDDGQTWQASDSATKSSITDFVVLPGRVVACGLDGTILESVDGVAFKATQRDDRVALTAALATTAHEPVFFSKRGPLTGRLQSPGVLVSP